MTDRTDWRRVGLLLGAGIVAALHIGKLPPALPLLSVELGLGLVQAGILVSVFNAIGALGGMFCGALAERAGVRRSMLAGLVLLAVCSAAGAMASTFPQLLALRLLEGLAFMFTVTAVPSLIVRAVLPAEHRQALGLWGSYMPTGMALMMSAGALMQGIGGWRTVWWLGAALSVLWAALLARSVPPDMARATAERPSASALLRAGLRRRPLALAACFSCYAAQFLAVMAFLPTLLVQRAGWGVVAAGLMAAAIVAVNAAGNVMAGGLAARGLPASRVLWTTALAMGVLGIGVFAEALPLPLRLGLAFGFSFVGGVIPGTLMGAAAQHAPRPELAGAAMGLLLQGAGLGQVLGPPLLGSAVQFSGSWQVGAAFCAVFATLAAALGAYGGRRSG
ncbi:MAG: CynX/NimT family MFS transporter [Aquabacterium sp.]